MQLLGQALDAGGAKKQGISGAVFLVWDIQMGFEPKIGGKPPKWMVKIMEKPMKSLLNMG